LIFDPYINFEGYPQATILDKDPFACKIYFFPHIGAPKEVQLPLFFPHIVVPPKDVQLSFIATHETLDS
jgi:hypothetical protein